VRQWPRGLGGHENRKVSERRWGQKGCGAEGASDAGAGQAGDLHGGAMPSAVFCRH
jgi:hypothetical protein